METRRSQIFGYKEMYHQFKKEGIQMSYTVEDFKREVAKKTLHTLSVEDRLEGCGLKIV